MPRDALPSTPAAAPRSRRQVRMAMGGLMLGMLLAALDQTIVATALPTIVGDLHGLPRLSWVVTGYILAMSVVMPIYGKLGDIYGRKSVYLSAIVIFLAGSALSGLATSMDQLIGFRVLQGFGAGGLVITAYAMIADLAGPRERARYQGYVGAVNGFAPVAGPIAGGFLTDQLSWRWAFYVNLPIGVLALLLGVLVIKLPRPAGRARIDVLGAALLAGALGALVLLASWGGTQYRWSSPVIIGLAVASALMSVLFVLVERRVPEPIIPLRLFRLTAFDIAAVASFVIGFARFGSVTFLPLFLQIVSGADATNSGLLLLPMMIGVIVAAKVSGQLIARTGRYKWSPIAGTATMLVGFCLLSTMNANTSEVVSCAYMVVLGISFGLSIPVMMLIAQNTAVHADVGSATSTVGLSLSIGASFGVSVFGAIFTARSAAEIDRLLPPSAAGQLAHNGSITPNLVHSLPSLLRHDFQVGYASALTDLFRWAVPFVVVAFVLALALREVPLRPAGESTPAVRQSPKAPPRFRR